jgi:rhodanese-related sulfurtransferase
MLFSALVWGMQGSQINRYATWDSLEPDTWASVWLIKQHLDPEAAIEIRPVGAPLHDVVSFAADTAQIKRSAQHSVYGELLARHGVTDSALLALGELLDAMEVAPWQATQRRLDADVLAREIRAIQQQFPEHLVPTDCYGALFDAVYRTLQGQGALPSDYSLQPVLTAPACARNVEALAQRVLRPFVKEVPLPALLHLIGSDKRVVFVDTREPAEFQENHIPGAINLPLRAVSMASVAPLREADLVVAYCIKDFRGYEVALALSRHGLSQAAVMLPRGLNGWQQSSLPVTGLNGLSEAEALAQLKVCAQQRTCLQEVAL